MSDEPLHPTADVERESEELDYLLSVVGFTYEDIGPILKQCKTGDVVADVDNKLRNGMTYPDIVTEYRLQYNPTAQQFAADLFKSLGFYQVGKLTEKEKLPPEFIVDGLIPCGLSIIVGAPKTRKSFLALDLADCVASGRDFLGRKTVKCLAAYFDFEGKKSRSSSRADAMGGISNDVSITHECRYFLAQRKGDNKTDSAQATLTDVIKQIHDVSPLHRLFIIDTYSRARGRVQTDGANAYDVDVQLLEPLQRLAADLNIAIVLIHHTRKGADRAGDSFEAANGTTGIVGSVDAALFLKTDGSRKDCKAQLEFTPRDAEPGELQIVFDRLRCRWRVEESHDDLLGMPLPAWVIQNAPEPKKIGQVIKYPDAYRAAYHTQFVPDDCAEKIRKILTTPDVRDRLFLEYGIACQVGAKSNDGHGIRMMRVL